MLQTHLAASIAVAVVTISQPLPGICRSHSGDQINTPPAAEDAR